MNISKIKPSVVLDSDQEDEVIHFDVSTDPRNGCLLYSKYRLLKNDFNGVPISDKDDFIRIKSLWYANLLNGEVEQILPYGEFDINGIHIADQFIYFVKVLDKDGDGLLGDDDYLYGTEIWRIHKQNKTVEFCFDCKDYNFHGFETANDKFVVFRSEDQIPDLTELVFFDILNSKKALLLNSHDDDDYNYQFIEDNNKNPTHFVAKKWILEAETSSPSHTLNIIKWDDLVSQLDWKSID